MLEKLCRKSNSFIAGGNVNWYSLYGKQHGSTSKMKNTLTMCPSNPSFCDQPIGFGHLPQQKLNSWDRCWCRGEEVYSGAMTRENGGLSSQRHLIFLCSHMDLTGCRKGKVLGCFGFFSYAIILLAFGTFIFLDLGCRTCHQEAWICCSPQPTTQCWTGCLRLGLPVGICRAQSMSAYPTQPPTCPMAPTDYLW